MLCQHNTFGQTKGQTIVDTFERRVIGHHCQLQQVLGAGGHAQGGIYFVGLVPSLVEDPETDMRLVFDAISEAGIAPGNVAFEVEEADLARDPERSERIRRYLRLKGFAFALCNAGVSAGGFSFQAVRDFAPDYIKLDKRLVRNLHQPLCAPIISKLVQLGESSGACVVAEGVDRLGMLEDLWLLGVRFMQGRLFSQEELPIM
jgi:EAL domain-containing protein (putative c-di-GMP-specific phosphodiesterase class I)